MEEDDFFKADGGIGGGASVETALEIFLGGLVDCLGANGYGAVAAEGDESGGGVCAAFVAVAGSGARGSGFRAIISGIDCGGRAGQVGHRRRR